MACPVASTNQLDRNKTDDPRAWALDPGTAAALSSYRDADRKDAKPADLVFVDPQGQPHSKFGLAMLLRSHLEAIGLKKERPELFETTAQRQQIRDHDLRGTFVTVALANGKSESWISDRTGNQPKPPAPPPPQPDSPPPRPHCAAEPPAAAAHTYWSPRE